MESFFEKLTMKTYGNAITKYIDDAIKVFVPDDDTADELSNWAIENDYPGFVFCRPGWYYWDDVNEEFYREDIHDEF